MSNHPKVLVEFEPNEIEWLSDRLHELRQGWILAEVFKVEGIQKRGSATENEQRMIEEINLHKEMEAKLRNRILNKASEQGFGEL